MRTYEQDLKDLGITSAEFDNEISRIYDMTADDMTALAKIIKSGNTILPVTQRAFERVLDMRSVERVEAYDTYYGNKRTPETIEINNSLEIVKLKGEVKFKHPLGYTLPSGYCLRHPEKGYFAFEGSTEPYIPAGGKRTLLDIMERQGGFQDFSNAVWLQPMEENKKQPDKYLEEFDKDIKSNGYKMTKNLGDNYKALVDSRNLDSPPSLEQISQEFLEGSTDNIVNAIGLELKMQEMERMEAMEACQ